MLKTLARVRVPLGFVSALVAFALARPTWHVWSIGLTVAAAGEAVRIWAAGHIDKGREITTSGPYRFLRHPLYTGSALIGVGFACAARSLPVFAIVALYLLITITAAVRTEEAELDRQFRGAYSDYRAGMMASVVRRFSWARAFRNREHRAVMGLIAAFVFLAWRAR